LNDKILMMVKAWVVLLYTRDPNFDHVAPATCGGLTRKGSFDTGKQAKLGI